MGFIVCCNQGLLTNWVHIYSRFGYHRWLMHDVIIADPLFFQLVLIWNIFYFLSVGKYLDICPNTTGAFQAKQLNFDSVFAPKWCFVWLIKICFVNRLLIIAHRRTPQKSEFCWQTNHEKKLGRRLQNTTACDLVGLSLIINERKPQKRKFATIPTYYSSCCCYHLPPVEHSWTS